MEIVGQFSPLNMLRTGATAPSPFTLPLCHCTNSASVHGKAHLRLLSATPKPKFVTAQIWVCEFAKMAPV